VQASRSLLDRRSVCVALLLGWCGLLFFYGLTAGELWRTEGLRAIIAAEFLHSGNWIVPTLYGEALFTKPPGMYAAIALRSLPFGAVSEWSARLPSALAATAIVFLFYWYFGRRFGRRAGLLAGLIVPMNFMWLDKASAAEIDMLQVAWVTASILFLLRALESSEDRGSRIEDRGSRIEAYRVGGNDQTAQFSFDPRSSILDPRSSNWGWWLAALLCVAGGTLTKWTAPAFFYATAIPLLWWRGQLRLLWRREHLLSAALAASIVAAWIIAAGALGGWDNLTSTVFREAMQRISPSHSPKPWSLGATLLHPLVVLATTLPWSVVALLTLRPGFMRLWDERGRRMLQALHCWLWPNLLLWSLMTEHAPRHSFPLFPAIAGLAVMVWIAWLEGKLSWRWPRVQPAKVLLVSLALWLAAKGVFVHAIIPHRNADREPRAKGELIASLVPQGFTLYLFRLKDEGIMFYYGRPVLRLASPADLPCRGTPVYCILEEAEWEQWQTPRPVQVLHHLTDEQGAPIVLVRVGG